MATGWSTEYLDDLEAEKILWLQLRWQYNEMRFSGMGIGSPGSGKKTNEKKDHWKSGTRTNANGTQTQRINVADMWNQGVANKINEAGSR